MEGWTEQRRKREEELEKLLQETMLRIDKAERVLEALHEAFENYT